MIPELELGDMLAVELELGGLPPGPCSSLSSSAGTHATRSYGDVRRVRNRHYLTTAGILPLLTLARDPRARHRAVGRTSVFRVGHNLADRSVAQSQQVWPVESPSTKIEHLLLIDGDGHLMRHQSHYLFRCSDCAAYPLFRRSRYLMQRCSDSGFPELRALRLHVLLQGHSLRPISRSRYSGSR